MKDIARKSALNVLNDIIKSGAYGNLALKAGFHNLDAQDIRFATRLVYGTLEKLISIDWILSNYLKKTTPLTVKNVLRLGVYQIYYMDSVPDRAACSASVDLAKAIGKTGASGFINAVLRNVARGKDNLAWPKHEDSYEEYVSVNYSFPLWIVKMTIEDLGKEKSYDLLSYECEMGITIRPNSLMNYTKEDLENELNSRNITFKKGILIDDAYIIKDSHAILNDDLFKSGKIAIQDEGSMYIAKLCLENNPKTVLDTCAAPGGKTSAMAHYNPKIDYYATDIHDHKIKIMEKQFKKLGVNAKTYYFDSSDKPFEIQVDTVLCDVPCSGLGTMLKQPDIKYSKSLSQIKELSALQYKILNNCANALNDNGVLIYSTCTIAKLENKDVVDKFLENNKNFEPIPPTDKRDIIQDNYDGVGLQLLPNVHGSAGFYIARLRKKNEK